VGGFEPLQLVHCGVVPGIGPIGGVENVVEVLVVAELVAEGLDLLVGREAGFRRHEEIIGSDEGGALALHLNEKE
jgi:hypothetical protein